jgi:hypothetical protein
MKGKNSSLFSEPNKTHDPLCGQNVEVLNDKHTSIYMYVQQPQKLQTVNKSCHRHCVIRGDPHLFSCYFCYQYYRGADKFLARPGRKQVTATGDFDFHISYL